MLKMANLKKRRKQKEIEAKYEKLIGDTIERMKENTMAELWEELDKLKMEMGKEFDNLGIKLESN